MLASIARRYPRVHTIAVVDVRRGPGLGPDKSMQEGIPMLKENGVTVLGYVETGDEDGSVDDIKQNMKNWKNWYPSIDGFYFTHIPRSDDVIPKSTNLISYARDYLEVKYLVVEFSKEGKPNLPRQFVLSSNIDLFVGYRDRTIPAPLSALKTGIEENRFQAHRFGIIITKMPTTAHSQKIAENFIMQAISNNAARYFYFHTDDGAREMHPYPFTTLSELLEVSVRQLDKIAAGEAILPAPPAPANPTEFYNKESQLLTGKTINTAIDNTLLDHDKFGVEKVYPDAPPKTFQDWYLRQESDPTKDLRLGYAPLVNLQRMQDGSKDTFLLSAKKSGPTRLVIASISDDKRWLNTESTIFFKYLHDIPNIERQPYAIQLLARLNANSCYTSAIFKEDGRTTIRKQITDKLFVNNRATQPAVTAHDVKDNWVGFKQVVYNVSEDGEPDTYVGIETYICQNITAEDGRLSIGGNQDWKLTSKFIDAGYWGLEDDKEEKKLSKLKSKSLKKSTDIINKPGNYLCGLAFEGVEMVISNWSVREIKVEQID